MTYGGDLFTTGHAWRMDDDHKLRCKWCRLLRCCGESLCSGVAGQAHAIHRAHKGATK